MEARSIEWVQWLRQIALGAMALLCVLGFGWIAGVNGIAALLFFGVVMVGVFLWVGVRDFFWPLAVTSLFFQGNFNFLPAGISPFEFLFLFGVGRFVMEQVVFGEKKIVLGPLGELVGLSVVVGILLFHGLENRFGMRVLGSDIWGGRGYISVLFAVLFYFMIQTDRTSTKAWWWFPLLMLIPSLFDLVVTGVTYFFPQTIPLVYAFYSKVNFSGLEGYDRAERWEALGLFGQEIILIILSFVPLTALWRPSCWWAALTLLGGLFLSPIGGYRSAVLKVFCLLGIASFRDFKGWGWLPLVGLSGALLLLGFLHGQNIVSLPKQAQRAFVFLPGGHWDKSMVLDAEHSNRFRWKTWSNWSLDFFRDRPWLGRGFGFPAAEVEALRQTIVYQPEETIHELLLLTQELHNGFLSVLDSVGIIGTFFFLLWQGCLFWKLLSFFLQKKEGFQNPGLQYVALALSSSSLVYFVGAIKLATFFPIQIVLASVFLRLTRSEESEEELREKKKLT